MSVRSYSAAMLAVARRDWLIYKSYRLRLINQVLQVLLSLTLFYYLSRIVRLDSVGSHEAYFAFAVVGLVILEVLTLTLGLLPSDLRQELVAGTFERLVVSPFGALGGVVSMTFFPVVLGLASGVMTITIAALIFGLKLSGAKILLAIPVALFGELTFVPFAVLITALVLCVKQAGAGAGYIVTLLSLIGGFYFPVSLLPGWISWASDVQPFTATVDLLRYLIVDTPLRESAWLSLAKLALSLVVLLPISVAVLGRAIRFSQRRGTIIEY